MISKNEIKELRELSRSSAFRQEKGLCVVEGTRAIRGALLAGGDLKELYLTKEMINDLRELNPTEVDQKVIERISTTTSPQGSVGIFAIPRPDKEKVISSNKIFVLDHISDPGNLGTIVRSALAFEIDSLVLVGGCDPYHPKTIRSSAGSVFGLEIYEAFDYELQDLFSPFALYSASGSAEKSLEDIEFDQNKIGIVFGNEANGITTQYFLNNATSFSINMAELVESLNVAMAAAIVGHELYKK